MISRDHRFVEDPARALWKCVEPYHAVTYFTDEARAAFEAIGLRGFWRGYFAGRAAPFGAVGPGVVVATFYGFRPDFVARAIPGVWNLAAPEQAIEARLQGAGGALAKLVDPRSREIARAATLARRACEGCEPFARPLFAANADLDWPGEPHLALWHGCTLLREHRGDGHVVALQSAGIDPCEAHVLRVAVAGVDPASIAPYRGWDDDDWRAAGSRLAAQGWLDHDGLVTTAGRTAHAAVESETDRLAQGPVERLGGDGVAELISLLRPVATGLAASGTIQFPNAIGVPRADGD